MNDSSSNNRHHIDQLSNPPIKLAFELHELWRSLLPTEMRLILS